jgi:hypothetical protein
VILADIKPALARLTPARPVLELRAYTYLATYPAIVSLASEPSALDFARFHQIAVMAYGWMPRILQLDREYMEPALMALRRARTATVADLVAGDIEPVSRCLHSVVGASKVLHFVNPYVFPISDSGIVRFRGIPVSDLEDERQYCVYVREVHRITQELGFDAFRKDFAAVYRARLEVSGIPPYEITPVRTVEAAAFELAPKPVRRVDRKQPRRGTGTRAHGHK